jgi:hypothetical protein
VPAWSALAALLVCGGAGASAPVVNPPEAGLLIIAGADDTTRGYRWGAEAEAEGRVLYWPGGYLVLPDSVAADRHGADDIAVRFGVSLHGYSEGRRLVFEPGRFVIRRPLLLTDGACFLFASRGELEVAPARLVYRDRAAAPPVRPNDRSQWLMLGGFAVLVAVLMLRSRSALRRR